MENIFQAELEKPTVFKDRNLIMPHYIPNELPFRENQIKEITSVLGTVLNRKKPNNLFLYGKTGTGKTSVTKFVLSQLNEFAEKNKVNIKTCYVNCRNHSSKYRALLKCVNEFYPNKNFLGYSSGFVLEKLIEFVKETERDVIIVLDEIDKVKDLDELIYSLTRANDEIGKGSISIVGVSNNLMFKDRLDPRTKSSLCEHEMVFPPYNAEELTEILKQRVKLAFKENTVEQPAINLAAAIAAKESGDARTGVMLLLRAGEQADNNSLQKVSEVQVLEAKQKVEEEIIFNMISTLPTQEQLVLLAIANVSMRSSGLTKITGEEEKELVFSGEVFNEYSSLAKRYQENPISSRWYRQYVSELEMYGLIVTTNSGQGYKGQTRFIKLDLDAKKIREVIEKEVNK